MLSFKLHPNFIGTGLQFSPWEPGCVAVSAAENFGVFGKGAIYFLRSRGMERPFTSSGYHCEFIAPLNDACYDVSFVESVNELLLAATGDGIKIIQGSGRKFEKTQTSFLEPVAHRSEHRGEVTTVNCNNIIKNMFSSGSNDKTFKIWDIEHRTSLSTCMAHEKEIYEVAWSPHSAFHMATCSGDGTIKFWDTRQIPRAPSRGTASCALMTAHSGAGVLSVDWNKYSNLVASSSVDQTVKLWDLRRADKEICALRGHDAAVRRVRWSPHNKSTLLSGGYDFRCCLWDIQNLASSKDSNNPLVQRYHHHSEFVIGLGWSLFQPNQVATCGFDGYVYSWSLGNQPMKTPSSVTPFPPVMAMQRTTPMSQKAQPRSVI